MGSKPKEQESSTFPMWVLPLSSFLEMSGAPRCWQELREKGLLVEQGEDAPMFTIFVSHQWISRGHPDPEGLQLSVLRKALSSIMSGRLVATQEWTDLILFGEFKRLTPAMLSSAYIWYDYWSVPQPGHAKQEEVKSTVKQMVHAVKSIPTYVRRAELFVVLAPELRHADTGNLCNFRTWRSRGWCRLEMASRGLRDPGDRNSIITVRSEREVSFTNPMMWDTTPVGSGVFTVDADRELLHPVIAGLIDQYATSSTTGTRQASANQRYIIAARRQLLTGFPEALVERSERSKTLEEEVRAFLKRLHFHSLLDRGEAGFGPMHCAAIEHRTRIIEEAVRQGVDVDVETAEDLNDLNFKVGMTPLCFAAYTGDAETARCLLSLRANAVKDISMFQPIHLACLGGTFHHREHTEVIDLLLAARADVQKEMFMAKSTPLHVSVIGTDTYVAEHLIELRADVNANAMAGTPLHNVSNVGKGAPDFVDILIRGRADINARVQPCNLPVKAIFSASRSALSCGVGAEALAIVGHMEGATPLALAALMGHRELCDALVAAGADVEMPNRLGRRPRELAEVGGHAEVLALLDPEAIVDFQMSSEEPEETAEEGNNAPAWMGIKSLRSTKSLKSRTRSAATLAGVA